MCTLTLQLGGPNWNVKLGRRDARTASQAAANNGIPPPTSNLNQLISRFNNLGLSTTDLVALSGLISLFFSCLIIFSTFDFILFMILFVRNILIHETRLNVGLNTCRFVLLQAPTQLDKQGAHPSGLVYTTRPTLTLHLPRQEDQTVQGPLAQGTTIWHLLMFKPPQNLRTTTTRTCFKIRDFSTLTNNYSMVDPQIQQCVPIATVKVISILILLLQ